MTQADHPLLELDSINQSIFRIESQIEQLTVNLDEAKKTVQTWVDANADLSESAQQARANTQAMGRGVGGLLLGSKFRAARRREAAYLNAQIARDVAERRMQVRLGKQNAQEKVKQIQDQLKQLRAELKLLKVQKKEAFGGAKRPIQSAKMPNESLKLMKKLHDLYETGLLTQEEYEQKRQKIISQI